MVYIFGMLEFKICEMLIYLTFDFIYNIYLSEKF